MKRVPAQLAAILGLTVLLAYLNFAFGWVVLSERLALTLAFGIGPVAVFGTISLCNRLASVCAGTTLHLGKIYLIIAFSLLTLMLTMQQAVFYEYEQKQELVASPGMDESLKDAFALVNQVQLGADVAFDIFYCLGIILISSALIQKRGLPRTVGAFGLAAASGLLALNIWFFPTPPAAAGSLDLGPVTIVWWLGLIFLDHRLKKSEDSGIV